MAVVVFKIRFSDAIYTELHWSVSGDVYGKLKGLFFELKQSAGFTSIAYCYVRCSLVSNLNHLDIDSRFHTQSFQVSNIESGSSV